MYLFCGMQRHALRMPLVGWLLGALPNERTTANSPSLPFTAQEFTLPLALRLGSFGNSSLCDADATRLGRLQRRCASGLASACKNRSTRLPRRSLSAALRHVAWHWQRAHTPRLAERQAARSNHTRAHSREACRKARRSQRYGSARLSSLRERVCMADHTRASLACVSAASEPSTSMDCTRPLGMA